ncbi:PREDICTED: uncharacterized protein LOC105450141 [Wasmannia auropunctata]|uniref:uncharacterized protein LOC105450141 n=1 Tax=Wasmannia auropunctata TaxID=64793 RepID=UPI0005EEF53C|nr:PREDICTED: uncharacterized protein LOC105450141 [Wasmannia auropunctata]
MIASKLKKENPLWDYTGQQCEDKFKDLRKRYVKIKDQNEKSSGLPVATCKFYQEMDEALGDKLAIKPVSIASTLQKRNQLGTRESSSSAVSSSSVCNVESSSDAEDDNEHGCKSPKSKKKKKSVIEKNIERLLSIKTEESKKKEEARQQRHIERMERQDRSMEIFQSAMNRLLDKL